MVEIEGYNLPDDLYYSDRHLWVRKESDGTLTLGFNDLAQKLIGKVMFVRLPKPETAVAIGKDFGTVESMKWVERLKSPVTGTVKEVNSQLRTTPGLVNKDPYVSGWMIKVQPSASIEDELSKLVYGPGLSDWLKKEIEEKVKKGKKT
jgi:glycine cleavage system H protein